MLIFSIPFLLTMISEVQALEIHAARLEPVVPRAQRAAFIKARLVNTTMEPLHVKACVRTPQGVILARDESDQKEIQIDGHGEVEISWALQAGNPLVSSVLLSASTSRGDTAQTEIPIRFIDPAPVESGDYPPIPSELPSDYLVGAIMCPLWKAGTEISGWTAIEPYPEREPALGWYDEGDPETADWEILWAMEHGVRFFLPCWYREKDNIGKPVKPVLEHWLHDGFLKSKYGSLMDFAILWENRNSIACGVESEEDLLNNLLPYWLEHYLLKSNYLKIDGKALIFVYGPEVLARELGGTDNTRRALQKMREASINAGLGGLILLGEHHGDPSHTLDEMRDSGFDYAYSYHWPTFTPLMPKDNNDVSAIISAQEACWKSQQDSACLPNIITLSMGWDARPWGMKGHEWHLPPDDFKALCRKARSHMDGRDAKGLSGKIVLLDNWNEFGEGHYIFPHRQYGFDYLDAVRSIFTSAAEDHREWLPEDLSLGPYDKLHREAKKNTQGKRK